VFALVELLEHIIHSTQYTSQTTFISLVEYTEHIDQYFRTGVSLSWPHARILCSPLPQIVKPNLANISKSIEKSKQATNTPSKITWKVKYTAHVSSRKNDPHRYSYNDFLQYTSRAHAQYTSRAQYKSRAQ